MPELPTGTVTFLFSDIEGSTRLLRSLGDAWPAVLERHSALMRGALAASGGVEVSTEGDSFFAVFVSPADAVTAAAAAVRSLADEPWPEDLPVRVRIGIHTGDGVVSGSTYVGIDVHRASRIAGVAHGGQVLLSEVTRSLVRDGLPGSVELRDLGEHRLKDLERAERLWQLVVPGLPDDFPPLAAGGTTPHNLPRRLTSFLGRETEIEEVATLLASHPLVTLTGPGGTGKTRLSLEVATRVLDRYDAVTFVQLGTIHQTELVTATIAQAMGLPDRGGRDPEDRIIDHIGSRAFLLLLDNFEQVLAAAPTVGILLGGAPALAVLATSRSALRIAGEQEYAVPPLALPDPRRLPPPADLQRYESIALFLERARAVKPDFALTDADATAVAEICVRLDGLPLAIELAAARIRTLPPRAMLGRLEHRLSLLSAGARDLPARQQTLRGAIAWSHDMLDEADRTLFACLSVFVGGADLGQIERVCGDSITGDLLDALTSLVEKSLVRQVEGEDGEPRFTMLQTIREYADEQAAESGARDELRARHAELFGEIASQAAARIMGSDKRRWLDLLEENHDNLRAASAWAVERDRADIAMRLGACLWRFWQMRGHLAEGLERLETALAMPGSHDHPAVRADALSAAAGLAYWRADDLRSRALYEEEIAARQALGDRRGLAEALYGLSFTWSILSLAEAGNAELAIGYIRDALAIFEELGDESGIGRCKWAIANAAYGTGDVALARQAATEALVVLRRLDDQFMVGWVTYTLGLADLTDLAEAGETSDRSEELLASAKRWFDEALRIFAEAQDVSGYTLVLDVVAFVALRTGDRQRAARLSGAVANLERTSGTGLNLWNRELIGFDPAVLRVDPSLADAWAEGERMAVDEAVADALEA